MKNIDIVPLTNKELKNINGGFDLTTIVVQFLITGIIDAIENPDDFMEGFNAGKIKKSNKTT